MVELFTINLSNSIYNKKAISEGRNVFAPMGFRFQLELRLSSSRTDVRFVASF